MQKSGMTERLLLVQEQLPSPFNHSGNARISLPLACQKVSIPISPITPLLYPHYSPPLSSCSYWLGSTSYIKHCLGQQYTRAPCFHERICNIWTYDILDVISSFPLPLPAIPCLSSSSTAHQKNHARNSSAATEWEETLDHSWYTKQQSRNNTITLFKSLGMFLATTPVPHSSEAAIISPPLLIYLYHIGAVFSHRASSQFSWNAASERAALVLSR